VKKALYAAGVTTEELARVEGAPPVESSQSTRVMEADVGADVLTRVRDLRYLWRHQLTQISSVKGFKGIKRTPAAQLKAELATRCSIGAQSIEFKRSAITDRPTRAVHAAAARPPLQPCGTGTPPQATPLAKLAPLEDALRAAPAVHRPGAAGTHRHIVDCTPPRRQSRGGTPLSPAVLPPVGSALEANGRRSSCDRANRFCGRRESNEGRHSLPALDCGRNSTGGAAVELQRRASFNVPERCMSDATPERRKSGTTPERLKSGGPAQERRESGACSSLPFLPGLSARKPSVGPAVESVRRPLPPPDSSRGLASSRLQRGLIMAKAGLALCGTARGNKPPVALPAEGSRQQGVLRSRRPMNGGRRPRLENPDGPAGRRLIKKKSHLEMDEMMMEDDTGLSWQERSRPTNMTTRRSTMFA